MKKTTLIGMILFFGLLANGQTNRFDLKATQKSLAKTQENLYFSKTEVTNAQYSVFLKNLKENNRTKELQIAQIDTTNWTKDLQYGEPLTVHYHSHPAYGVYPVVNISHEGATLFCQWMTDLYNANEKRKFKKVIFRLPTEQEWITAAKGGNPEAIYPWEGNQLMNEKGVPLCNFVRAAEDTMGVANIHNDGSQLTAPSKFYLPNGFGLYNMSGNVAEMIANKEQTMGGCWLDNAEAMKIASEGKFSNFYKPAPTIGFRYVMEVIEE